MSHVSPAQPYQRLLPASDQHASASNTGNPGRRAKAKISTACLTCKHKRTKCSGYPPPCRSCSEAKAECVFDFSLDQRRRLAGKKRDEDFKSQTIMVQGLFEIIRSSEESKVRELLAMIRANASMASITAAVEASTAISERSMKRKRSVSSSASSREGKAAAKRSGSDDHTMPPHTRLQGVLNESETAASTSISVPAPYQLASPQEPIGVTTFTFGSDHQSHSILDLAQYLTLERAEESFSEDSPNLGDDELSPVEHLHQIHGWLDGRSSQDSPLDIASNQQRRRQHPSYPAPGYVEVFGNLPMSSAIMTNGYPRNIQIQQLCHFRIPIHLIQSLITFDDSALARVFTDYRDAARHMLASGVPYLEVSGPDFTAIDLFFRDRVPSDPYTASFWACEVCKTFGDASIFVQLAGMYLLTYLMRWTIFPTKETYAKVPQMIKPTPMQRLIPHVASIDLVALAPVRNALITRMHDFVSNMITAGISCNWPYTLDECFETDQDTGQRKLTKIFEEYVSDYDHWSVGSQFLDTFPELQSRVHIKEPEVPPRASSELL